MLVLAAIGFSTLRPFKVWTPVAGVAAVDHRRRVFGLVRHVADRRREGPAATVAGDVHRPAAFEQLQQVAHSVGAGFFGAKGEKDAVKIARDALDKLKDYDVLIYDSAGRSGFDEELARELSEVNNVFRADERFLVVSADVGQVAGKQAVEFDKAVGITGVIITKMDGSGKGGGWS